MNQARIAQLASFLEPQPPPITTDRSRDLWPKLCCDLHNEGWRDLALLGSIRDDFGRQKYKCALTTWNGHSFLCDALQEGMDAIVYLSGELTQREELNDAAGASAVAAALRAQIGATSGVLALLLDPCHAS